MKTRISCIVIFLVLAFPLSMQVVAQSEDLLARLATERVSLNLKEASADDVFGIYKKLLGVELDMACREEKTVTIAFEEITLRTSLNAICESAGLVWEIIDGEPVVLRVECGEKLPDSAYDDKYAHQSAGAAAGPNVMATHGGKSGEGDPAKMVVDLNLHEADLDDVLNMVAKLLDAEVLLDRSLEGRTVTLYEKSASVEELLDAICEEAGAEWNLKEGDQNFLTIDAKN